MAEADDVIDRAAGTALVKCDVMPSDVIPCDVIAGADVYRGLRLRDVAPLWLKYPESAGKVFIIPLDVAASVFEESFWTPTTLLFYHPKTTAKVVLFFIGFFFFWFK